MPSLKDRFMCFVCPTEVGCWYWSGYRNKDGYGKIQLTHASNDLAHRISWKLFKGSIPDGQYVLHRCDTPFCVNPDHLFLGTQRVNVQDMFQKGRANRPVGERNAKAKLTAAVVKLIRADHLTSAELSRKYKISWAQADRIKRRLNWKHLGD